MLIYFHWMDFLLFCHVEVHEHHCSRWWYCSIYYLLGHKIEHYHYHELWFAYCNTFTLTWSLLKLENGIKKHITNVEEIKYEFVKLVSIFLLLIKCWSLIVFLTCPNRVLSESPLQSCLHVKELLSQNPLYI